MLREPCLKTADCLLPSFYGSGSQGPERDANVLKVMHGEEQKPDSSMHPKPGREASGAQFDSRGLPNLEGGWKEVLGSLPVL